MTKPQSLPLALATALHAAAVLFLPKPPPFAFAADPETGAHLAWAWLTADVCVVLDGAAVGAPPPPDRSDAIAAPILTALRRGVQEGASARPAPELDARVFEAFRVASSHAVDVPAAALHAFAASLPASVPWAWVPSPDGVQRRRTLVPVVTLRALGYGDQQLRARTTTLRGDDGQHRPAVLFEGPGWRAVVRGVSTRDANAWTDSAPQLDAARPVVLACAGCGRVSGLHATEAEALDTARRRRWQRRETDEGTVAFCAPCAAASAASAAMGVA